MTRWLWLSRGYAVARESASTGVAVMGCLAYRRSARGPCRRWFPLADGLALGAAARSRSYGPRRRQNDVRGWSLPWLAAGHPDDLHWSLRRLDHRCSNNDR